MSQLMYGLSRSTAVADSPPGLCPANCAVMDTQSVSSCANLQPHKCHSTLQLRSLLYPKSCLYNPGWFGWQRCYPILISVKHGEVTVADSAITDTDIAASNGVIHITSRLLNNPKLKLATRCPPPTTPPMTSSSPIYYRWANHFTNHFTYNLNHLPYPYQATWWGHWCCLAWMWTSNYSAAVWHTC